MEPLTNHGPGCAGPTERTGVFPATAALRRVTASASGRAPSSAPLWAVVIGQPSGARRGHLGPAEPGQLPGDGAGDHALGVLALGQPPEPAAQPLLGLPGAGDRLRGQPLLPFAQRR